MSESSMVQPNLNKTDIKLIVENIFKMETLSIEAMKSFIDQNYKIQCLNQKTAFNLKILNSQDSKYPELIEIEHKILFHLKTEKLKCPVPFFNNQENSTYFYLNDQKQLFKSNFVSIDGDQVILKQDSNYFVVRLLEFLPGKTLYDANVYSELLLFNVGYYAACIDSALEGFYDSIFQNSTSTWYLEKISDYAFKIEFIKDEKMRNRVRCIVEEFIHKFLNNNNLVNFKRGVIHGDLNDENILTDDSMINVTGIIDFGDMHFSYYVFEIAICALYMMLDAVRSPQQHGLDQIEIGAHVIAGYLSKLKLSIDEFSSILICIKTRIAQSLMNSSYAFHLNPSNTYIIKNQRNAWDLLCRLDYMKEDDVYKIWKDILKTKYDISFLKKN